MFKIGDLVTKEQFIKYAPYGMELKHDCEEVILRYDMKAYEDFCSSDDIEYWVDTVPGFMYCGFRSPEPMDGVWGALKDDIEEYNINGNLYRIHKLPILKLLKRKQL